MTSPVLSQSPGSLEPAFTFDGLSKLQVSIVVSLEITRLLLGPGDAELAAKAQTCGTRAWELFRRTGSFLLRSAQAAQRVSQSAKSGRMAEADFMAELEGEGKSVEKSYASLGHDVRDLVGNVHRRLEAGELRDIPLALPDGKPQAPLALDGWLNRRFAELRQLRANLSPSDLGKADLLEFLLAGRKTLAMDSDEEDAVALCQQLAQNVSQPLLLDELHHVDSALDDSHAFWGQVRRQLFRLSLAKEHLTKLGEYTGQSQKLRVVRQLRLEEYSTMWRSFHGHCS